LQHVAALQHWIQVMEKVAIEITGGTTDRTSRQGLDAACVLLLMA